MIPSGLHLVPQSCLAREAIDSLLYYASRAPLGAIVEVGVYRGGSAWHLAQLARQQGRQLYLFDTFEGMPEAGPLDVANPVGKFADTSAEAVQALIPDARLVKGVFPQSLQDVRLPLVGFVHADADNYAVTKAILAEMPRRMVKGGIIVFDDFMVEGCEGCTRAITESPYRVLVATETGKALVIV